jgi:hypothetical protein
LLLELTNFLALFDTILNFNSGLLRNYNYFNFLLVSRVRVRPKAALKTSGGATRISGRENRKSGSAAAVKLATVVPVPKPGVTATRTKSGTRRSATRGAAAIVAAGPAPKPPERTPDSTLRILAVA